MGPLISKDQLRDEHTLDINQDVYCAIWHITWFKEVNQTDGNLTIKNIKLYKHRAQNKLWRRQKKKKKATGFVLKDKGRKGILASIKTLKKDI